LILLQQGKGAAAGASFGSGASQTVFGSDGGGSFFTRATAIFAAIFFCTSLGLAVIAKNHSKIAAQDIPAPITQQAPNTTVTAPAPSDVPVVQTKTEPAANDIPVVPAK
jgi:preprotein translocase subunit SecG